MNPDVQELPAEIFSALGIRGRAGFRPFLANGVVITVQVPLPSEGTGASVNTRNIFADDETEANTAFIGSRTIPGVAAEFSKSQIKNAAGSGKVVFIDSVQLCGASDIYILGRHDADLANVDAAAFINKNVGEAVPSAEFRYANGVGAVVLSAQIACPANDATTMVFNPPIRLQAGEGYACENVAANIAQRPTWQIREYTAS